MVSPQKPFRFNSVALGLKLRESVSNLGSPGRISCFISNRNGSSGFRRSSPRPHPNEREVPVCSPGCPLQHLLSVTPLPWDLSPENRCQTWNPRAKFRILIVYNGKFEGPPFEPPTSTQLAGSARVLVRVSPLKPSRCNPVALGLKP